MSALLEALRTRQPLAVVANTGPRTWHGVNGGECANVLDTLPVFLRYELVADRCGSDVAEITDVCIDGHVLGAGNFDVCLCAEWGRQCMDARAKAGWL